MQTTTLQPPTPHPYFQSHLQIFDLIEFILSLNLKSEIRFQYGPRKGSDEEDREPGAPTGHLLQAPSRSAQEGKGALRPLRC